jgi:hypothetical protein
MIWKVDGKMVIDMKDDKGEVHKYDACFGPEARANARARCCRLVPECAFRCFVRGVPARLSVSVCARARLAVWRS